MIRPIFSYKGNEFLSAKEERAAAQENGRGRKIYIDFLLKIFFREVP